MAMNPRRNSCLQGHRRREIVCSIMGVTSSRHDLLKEYTVIQKSIGYFYSLRRLVTASKYAAVPLSVIQGGARS